MTLAKVNWTKIAINDLESVFNYIAEIEDRPETARLMIKKIIEGVDQIKSFPESGRPGRVKGTKELIIVTTPFIVVYKMKKGSLEILTVLHHARKWE